MLETFPHDTPSIASSVVLPTNAVAAPTAKAEELAARKITTAETDSRLMGFPVWGGRNIKGDDNKRKFGQVSMARSAAYR